LNQPKSKKIPTLTVNYLIQQENTEFSRSIVGDLKDYTVEKEEKAPETKPVVVTIDGQEYEDKTKEMTNGYKEVMKQLEELKNEAVEVEPVEIIEPTESVEMDEVSDLLDGLSPAQIALLKNRLNQPE
jgi:sulfatase maturation enzyme AslB (radical SAM superfamily)